MVGVGLLLMRGVEPDSSWTTLLAGFLVAGIGIGLYQSRRSARRRSPSSRRRSRAWRSGINTTFRQVGIATGVAALGAVFQSRIDSKLVASCCRSAPGGLAEAVASGGTRAAERRAAPAPRPGGPRRGHVAFVGAFNEILLIGALILFVGALAGFLLVRSSDFVQPTEPASPRRAARCNPSGRAVCYTESVLRELRIENLLLIERAELRLGEGLNVITGETGAGKTVLAHSLDLLMGGKARPQIVRPGAEEAWVEGVFDLPEGLLEEPEMAEIAERLPEGADEVVLGAARLGAAGGPAPSSPAGPPRRRS